MSISFCVSSTEKLLNCRVRVNRPQVRHVRMAQHVTGQRAPEITIGFAGGKPIGQVMENFTFPDIERHVIWIALPDRHAEDVAGAQVFCPPRSEEHTSELQSLMRISYAVFCLKKKK